MEGIILVDKPADWTSFDVVNYIRRQVAETVGKKPKNVKVGHAGTLDPFATGLLIVLVGKNYTRQAADFSKKDKTYELSAILGKKSTTGDPEGEISDFNNRVPTLEEINEILDKYRGEIMQTPPIYSAIKVDGQRAYKLARQGKEVEIEPRQVTIKRLELISYEYPKLSLLAEVSSGTYIRSLVEDIGQDLGVGAYTEQLRRTAIDRFEVKHAAMPKSETILNQLNKNIA